MQPLVMHQKTAFNSQLLNFQQIQQRIFQFVQIRRRGGSEQIRCSSKGLFQFANGKFNPHG